MQIFANGKRHVYSFMKVYVIHSKSVSILHSSSTLSLSQKFKSKGYWALLGRCFFFHSLCDCNSYQFSTNRLPYEKDDLNPYCAISRVDLLFCFGSCKMPQNIKITSWKARAYGIFTRVGEVSEIERVSAVGNVLWLRDMWRYIR